MERPLVHKPLDLSGVNKFAKSDDPPTVREKLLHKEDVLFTPQAVENKDVPDEAWLSPIMSDIRRMPMHTALALASQIISQLSSEAKIESFDLALAMNRWARTVPPDRGGKVGDNDTQGKA